jgi:hypothetical protein
MSYFLDQIKRASLNEAAELLAAKYVENVGKRSGLTKSAEIGSSSLYGAAAGAGVGGLGTLGLDYLTGKEVNARRALSGALIGAVPGAAAGALADTYLTPAEKDPSNPKTGPTASLGGFFNLFTPKIPGGGNFIEEAIAGGVGARYGIRAGKWINNSALGKALGIVPHEGWKSVEDRVAALNTAHTDLFPARQTAQNTYDFEKAKGTSPSATLDQKNRWKEIGPDLERELNLATDKYKSIAPKGSADIRFIDPSVAPATWKDRIKSLLPDWNKSIETTKQVPVMDMTKSPPVPLTTQAAVANKFRAVPNGKSLVAPTALGIGGFFGGIGLDRLLNSPGNKLINYLTGTGGDTNAPK